MSVVHTCIHNNFQICTVLSFQGSYVPKADKSPAALRSYNRYHRRDMRTRRRSLHDADGPGGGNYKFY